MRNLTNLSYIKIKANKKYCTDIPIFIHSSFGSRFKVSLNSQQQKLANNKHFDTKWLKSSIFAAHWKNVLIKIFIIVFFSEVAVKPKHSTVLILRTQN